MKKIKYEIDPHNRLIALGSGGLRKVLDGTFKISGGHHLLYHVKRPVARGGIQQIKFSGRWALKRGSVLVLTLDKWGQGIAGDKLVLKADAVSAGGNELVFSLRSRKEGAGEKIDLLTFTGIWRADAENRLVFSVGKERTAPDQLKLEGSWTLNKEQALEFTFLKSAETEARQTILFKGVWEFTGRDKLTYALRKGIGSQFDFKAALERAASDRLVYSLGIGIEPEKRKIALLGTWRYDRRYGLRFETTAAGDVSTIAFAAKARLQEGMSAELELKTSAAESLGVTLTLSVKFMGGEALLRVLKEAKGAAVFLGYGRAW